MSATPPNARDPALGGDLVPAPIQKAVDDIVKLVPKDKQDQAKERAVQIVAKTAVSMVPAFLNGRRERGARRDDEAMADPAHRPDPQANLPAQPRQPPKNRKR